MTDSDNAPDGLDDATRFLRALFEPQDIICFRPIETWTEGAKKQSKVIHSDMTWVSDQNGTLKVHVLRMMKMAPAKHANLFFGVAPRFNHKHFDLAWQVRKLNALWSDIDHVSTDEALARCNGAGLPVPSIVINSGNGAHVYWLLDSPYMIDDASAPPAVLTEFIDQGPGKKKKVLKWFKDETGERVELTAKGVAPKLSNKGQFAQDVLQGIAAKIGGDATHDLSRLLRLPGTMNRKDARGGKPPVPCTIVELDQSRRYAFDQFSSFAAQSPDAQRRVKIAAVPLPQPKKLFGKRLEKFEDAVARCAIAEQGSRSEADFAACALAVRSGVAKVDAWAKLQFVGKFAEGGERYFERTWARAEEKAREQKFEVLSGATKTRTKSNPATTNTAPTERHSIELSPFVPVSTTLRQITDYLVQERVIYRRAEQGVVVDGDRIGPVLSPQQFIGLISAHIEFYKQESESVSHTTLPANLANAWFHNPHEQKRLPCIALFTRNPQFVQGWRLTQPGFDEDSGVYYAGPAVAAREGTQHLDAMLEGFCFKKPADRTNLIGMLLTTLCTGKFIGSKPGVIATGNQPSLGKTTLMQTIAIIRDGDRVPTVSFNADDTEFEKAIGAKVKEGYTVIIIDNAKPKDRRNTKIESACLERSITDSVLSYRLLGSSSDIRCENSHIFCITANTPEISRDLVTRCIPINLYHEGDPERREFKLADPEGYATEHRLEIIGELIGMVERWKASGMPMATVHTRFNKKGWGNIIGGILQVCGEPDFLANADESSIAMDQTRSEFEELVALLADHPQGTWTAAELVEFAKRHRLLINEIGDGTARSQSTRMGILMGRFLKEPVVLDKERSAVLKRKDGEDGKTYSVAINGDPEPTERSGVDQTNVPAKGSAASMFD